MNLFNLQTAHAAPTSPAAHSATETESPTTTTTSETTTETHAEGGLSIQPAVIAFQGLNFLILVAVLYKVLYKPILKMMHDREQKIVEGLANAEKAKVALHETENIRKDMVKQAHVDGQQVIEKARKSAEEMRATMVQKAQDEANKIVKNAQEVATAEKTKMMSEMKMMAAHMVLRATEKVIQEKMDASKDAQLIEKSLNSYLS